MKLFSKQSVLALIFSVILLFSTGLNADIQIGPYLQPTDDMETSVGIAWRSSGSSAGTVDYGESSISENSVSTSSGTIHYIKLTGLSAGTEYTYRITCDGTTTPEYTFRTSSQTEERRVLWMSDFHATTDNWIAQQAHWLPSVIAYDPDLVVISGDLVHSGTSSSDWETFFAVWGDVWATAILAPCIGNHEADYASFFDYFTLPANAAGHEEESYYMDYGGVRWTMIGQGSQFEETWVDTVTADAFNGNEFSIGLKHHPIYLSCEYDDEMALDMDHADNVGKVGLRQIIEDNGVDVFLTGHRHLYHRTFPMHRSVAEPAAYAPAPFGDGWGGMADTDSANYTDPDGVIHIEQNSMYYQKPGGIYQRPHIAAVGPESGDDGKEWLGYSTLTINSSVLTYDAYAFSRDGAIKNQVIDHFVMDKSGLASISGTITESSTGLEGIQVTAVGPHTAGAITNSNGEYTIPGLPDGTYTVTPQKMGYSFAPVSRSVEISSNADESGIDFSGANTGGTVTFQNGSSNYDGQLDCFIDGSSMEDSYDSSGMIHLRLDDSVSQQAFFQWDLSSIPTDAVVLSATVTMWVYRTSKSTNTGSVYQVDAAWDESSAFSLLNGIAKTDLGIDYTFARSGSDTTLDPPQEMTISLSSTAALAMVSGWVADSADNHGINIIAEDCDMRILAAEHPDPQYCPKLTVEYSAGSGGDDTDGDGMHDAWENANGTDPDVPDADVDGDADGLTNSEEYDAGTHPGDNDSDDDGLLDGYEVETSETNPLDDDSDNDGLTDGYEVNILASNPNSNDSDNDLMPDAWEVDNGLDLNSVDADLDPDNDNLTNLIEYGMQTDPQNPDTDGDGENDDIDPSPLSKPTVTKAEETAGCSGGSAGSLLMIAAAFWVLMRMT